MATLSWTLSAEVQGGPKIGVAQTLAVESYDKTEVSIPAKTTAKPSTTVSTGAAGKVTFLAILADRYGDKLTVLPTGGKGTPTPLEAPLILVGAGAVALLGGDVAKLDFVNELADKNPVVIQILVGRNSA